MEPVGMIVSALAAGAVAALKPTAEQAVKDVYAGLKALVQRRCAAAPVDALERHPDSAAEQGAVAQSLDAAGAAADEALLAKARELAATLQRHDAEAGRSIGVDLGVIVADDVEFGDVTAGPNATGVRADEIRAPGPGGKVKFGAVAAGVPPRP